MCTRFRVFQSGFVMMQMSGQLKDQHNSKDEVELLEWFEIYRTGRVSRVTPLMLPV